MCVELIDDVVEFIGEGLEARYTAKDDGGFDVAGGSEIMYMNSFADLDVAADEAGVGRLYFAGHDER